ncbi:MAG: prolipoprotein diacylglyceryl transferase, partial [bacterium]
RLSIKEGYGKDDILDLGLVAIFTSVIGARVLYVIVWWEYFAKEPLSIFKVWEGGLVFYGGLIGAVIGSAVWLRLKKKPVLKTGDICMPFLALAHAIGRLGCFFNGCCYGKVSEKYGVVFPGAGDNLPHLPVQLYESAMNTVNFAVLMVFYRFFRKNDGEVFFLYFINYAVIRTVMEMFRGDAERGMMFGMSTSTFVSIIILIFGLSGFIYIRLKNGKKV